MVCLKRYFFKLYYLTYNVVLRHWGPLADEVDVESEEGMSDAGCLVSLKSSGSEALLSWMAPTPIYYVSNPVTAGFSSTR